MPLPWGRPPPGLSRRDRERWLYSQQQGLYDDALRFQELDSEDEQHGVPVLKGSKGGNKDRRNISDELFFNDGGSRFPRQSYSDEHLAYGEAYYQYDSPESQQSSGSSGQDDDSSEGRRPSNSLVRRDSDQIMAQRALDRIDRAKAKGKSSVNLTHEEIEALERFRRAPSDSPERARRGSGDKNKRRSPSGSGNNGAKAWTRKRTSSSAAGTRRSSLIASASSTALAPTKQRTKDRKKQSPNLEEAVPQQMPPGMMVVGPGGAPMYQPLGYHNAPPPSQRRQTSDGYRYSPPRSGESSRSTSASSRRAVPTGYDNVPPYPTSRHSSSRAASDADYYAQQQYAQYQTYPPPGYPPAGGDGRRVSSGPPQVAYSNVYRRVPAPAAARGRNSQAPNQSDPSLYYQERGPSGLGVEYEPSSATSDDEESEDELSREMPPPRVERRAVPPPQQPPAESRRRRRRG